MVYCLAGFQEFICSLGTNSPVSAYIPLTGIPILQECINGLEIRKNIPKWKIFQTQLPLLANMLQKIGMDSIPRYSNRHSKEEEEEKITIFYWFLEN